MESVKVKATTWVCETKPLCEFKWQFDGNALGTSPHDLTQEQVTAIFPNAPGLQPGKCLRCYRYGLDSNLEREVDTENMSEITVSSDAQLEASQVDELDQDDQPIMVQTGSRYELRVNQSTGAIYSEEVPIMEPKMRSLTTLELAELKEQRDKNLDQLESIAVKEI